MMEAITFRIKDGSALTTLWLSFVPNVGMKFVADKGWLGAEDGEIFVVSSVVYNCSDHRITCEVIRNSW